MIVRTSLDGGQSEAIGGQNEAIDGAQNEARLWSERGRVTVWPERDNRVQTGCR